jgi:hypothetical protein
MNTASLNVKDEFLQASEVTKIFILNSQKNPFPNNPQRKIGHTLRCTNS